MLGKEKQLENVEIQPVLLRNSIRYQARNIKVSDTIPIVN